MLKIYSLFFFLNALIITAAIMIFRDQAKLDLFIDTISNERYLLVNIALGIIILFIYFILLRKIIKYFLPRWRVKQAAKILKKVREHNFSLNQTIGYLRKIDFFTFEELLLTCFKEKGIKIKRNRRYTGDGGIDGIIYLNRKKTFIQAKRYKNHISKQHVEEFLILCKKNKCNGLFIHTGKTGKQTKLVFNGNDEIELISGEKLHDLIFKKNILVFGKTI